MKRSTFPRPTRTTFLNIHGGEPQDVDNNHCIIRATLNDGQVFAIDLTGAQYGWDETIVPWKDYTQRIEKTKNTYPVEIMRDKGVCDDHDFFAEYQPRAIYFMHSVDEAEREVVEAIEVCLKRWLRECNMNVVDFLDQAGSYEMQALELLLCIVVDIESLLCLFKQQGKYFYAHGRDGVAFLTTGSVGN